MNRSLASIAARIRESKDSPAGSDERSRKTVCPSPLSESSMRVAISPCSDEYERKMVCFTAVSPALAASTLQQRAAARQGSAARNRQKKSGPATRARPASGGSLDLGRERPRALNEGAHVDTVEIIGQPRARFLRHPVAGKVDHGGRGVAVGAHQLLAETGSGRLQSPSPPAVIRIDLHHPSFTRLLCWGGAHATADARNYSGR